MRWVAKNVVAAGLAQRCEVQVAYAIGKAHPVGLFVETFGTGDRARTTQIAGRGPGGLRPAARPRSSATSTCCARSTPQTAAYGHFGRELPDFTWERTDRGGEARRGSGRLTPVRTTPMADPPREDDQLALIGPRGGLLPRRGRAAAAPVTPEGARTVQVVIDSPLRRLDREFDYLVPAKLEGRARFGMRVRVPFAGQRVDGFVVGQAPPASPARELAAIHAVVGSTPALTPQSLALCRAVAEHYAGTLPDVLRLAVPPRHAAAEAEAVAPRCRCWCPRRRLRSGWTPARADGGGAAGRDGLGRRGRPLPGGCGGRRRARPGRGPRRAGPAPPRGRAGRTRAGRVRGRAGRGRRPGPALGRLPAGGLGGRPDRRGHAVGGVRPARRPVAARAVGRRR